MATRRKAVKIRDAGQTQRGLLDAVGAILREKGFHAINATSVAERAGKDKKLVRHYFKTLKELEKAYIREKDYWPPFFKRFKLGAGSGAEETEAMFQELMKANFRYFRRDKEMQQIILWQISESNPALRAISESREAEGAKLLALTDPYFEGSAVNFKAVMALLLGGIYYVTLHARYNKSTVSGIDVNKTEDRKALLQTITQVIGWAWAEGTEK